MPQRKPMTVHEAREIITALEDVLEGIAKVADGYFSSSGGKDAFYHGYTCGLRHAVDHLVNARSEIMEGEDHAAP